VKANLARFTRWTMLAAIPLLNVVLFLDFSGRGIRWDF
jgi:hypothetical protein